MTRRSPGQRTTSAGNQTDDGAAGFVEMLDGVASGGAAQEDRRAVASVHVGETAVGGIILRVKESGVTVFGGCIVDHAVEAGDKSGEVVAGAHGVGAE
jgi:hypothetical protein